MLTDDFLLGFGAGKAAGGGGGGSGGGSSRFCSGEFMFEDNGSHSIELPYDGNGYPVAIVISLAEGSYNPDGAAYNSPVKKALTAFAAVKCAPGIPDYTKGAIDALNSCSILYLYQSSTTPAAPSSGYNAKIRVFTNNDASVLQADNMLHVDENNTLKVYCMGAPTRYCFLTNVRYFYNVIFSE